EVQVRADVRLLHDVLDLGLVAEEGTHRTVDALVVTAHEDLEAVAITRANELDDPVVGQISRNIHPPHRRTSPTGGYRLFGAARRRPERTASSSKNICGISARSTPRAAASSESTAARRRTFFFGIAWSDPMRRRCTGSGAFLRRVRPRGASVSWARRASVGSRLRRTSPVSTRRATTTETELGSVMVLAASWA